MVHNVPPRAGLSSQRADFFESSKMAFWAAEHAAKPRKLNIFLRLFFENFRHRQARAAASYLFEHLVVFLAAERARRSCANTNILTLVLLAFSCSSLQLRLFFNFLGAAGRLVSLVRKFFRASGPETTTSENDRQVFFQQAQPTFKFKFTKVQFAEYSQNIYMVSRICRNSQGIPDPLSPLPQRPVVII
ncbi:hypothetical protein C8J57DRAFT_1251817 [Mycena rebaudengoi]|nr:hypothetical protein C8J57DRAFT_1251817 [Mycena rebaudengoi]